MYKGNIRMNGLTYTLHETVWGILAAAWSDTGLWELTFPQTDPPAAIAKMNSQALPAGVMSQTSGVLDRELKSYFSGQPVRFSVPIDWRHYTSFQKAALIRCASIGYGQTLTYKEIAAAAGSAGAFRAAGGAMHINRTPIVVPCHRVVGSNGWLGGFGGGLELKKALLDMERHQQ